MVKTEKDIKARLCKELEKVMDPEIPVLSIIDLGIIPDIEFNEGSVVVKMTPTFSACPAIQVMKDDIIKTLNNLEFVKETEVKVDFERKWTSDLISEKGKEKLKNFGITPPKQHNGKVTMDLIKDAHCPYCESEDTTMKTLFGSALCRSFHYCFSCKQTFERFKPID